jgi:hypothetical protein
LKKRVRFPKINNIGKNEKQHDIGHVIIRGAT